ncbi:unnamed protein product [Durusdinium trenchii]|uniref:RHD domain-containing protein n=1 Tax=Durusdinium trenchii TaxID=1381693 RepID=A0ABP0MZQ1_9DINO
MEQPSLGPGIQPYGKSPLKRKLTEIPDTECPVTLRVQFLLIGEASRDFASMVVNSEMAENYHGQRRMSMASLPDQHSSAGSELQDANRYLLFCPRIDRDEGTELARIELTPVVGFGDSLPLSRQQNENIHLIFLLYQDSGPRRNMSDLSTEWIRRLAEVRFLPKIARPALTLLMVSADDEQMRFAEEIMEKQKDMDDPLTVSTKLVETPSEDDLISSLQLVCKDTVLWKPHARYTMQVEAKGGCE